jgi:hypothetical protein
MLQCYTDSSIPVVPDLSQPRAALGATFMRRYLAVFELGKLQTPFVNLSASPLPRDTSDVVIFAGEFLRDGDPGPSSENKNNRVGCIVFLYSVS